MINIDSIVQNAIDRKIAEVIPNKMAQIVNQISNAIRHEIDTDISQSPGGKYVDILHMNNVYTVKYEYSGGYDGKIIIETTDDLPDDAKSYLSSAVYQGTQYVLG